MLVSLVTLLSLVLATSTTANLLHPTAALAHKIAREEIVPRARRLQADEAAVLIFLCALFSNDDAAFGNSTDDLFSGLGDDFFGNGTDDFFGNSTDDLFSNSTDDLFANSTDDFFGSEVSFDDCTCEFPTFSCFSSEPQCEDGVCFNYTTSFTFSDDLTSIDELKVCVVYVSGEVEGIEDGCVSFGVTGDELTSCAYVV